MTYVGMTEALHSFESNKQHVIGSVDGASDTVYGMCNGNTSSQD